MRSTAPPILSLLLAALLPAAAQLPPRAPAPQPAPPPQPLDAAAAEKLLKQLEELGKTRDDKFYGHLSGIIRQLREAGASGERAFSLWLDAVKDVEFDQKGKTMTEFSEWKRRQTKDPDRERDEGLRLQVQWLSIVLMDQHAKTDAARAEAAAAASSYVDALVEQAKKNDGKFGAPARENVMTSVFARHFKVDGGAKEGPFVPEDINAIYDQLILPRLRAAKQSASLMSAWTKRIAQQAALAEAKKFAEAKEIFTTEKLPELKWGQTRELYQLGQEATAGPALVAHIRTYMGHRKAGDWILELKALLQKNPAPAVEPAPEPAPPLPPQ